MWVKEIDFDEGGFKNKQGIESAKKIIDFKDHIGNKHARRVLKIITRQESPNI